MRLIDADELLSRLRNEKGYKGMCKARLIVIGMPTIEPEVRHGRWIEDSTDVVCSSCGCRYNGELFCMSYEDGAFSRCPKCGAKLEGDVEND